MKLRIIQDGNLHYKIQGKWIFWCVKFLVS